MKSRRPALAALIAVLLGSLVLGLIGLGVEDKLDPLSLTISGTSSAEGEALAEEHFGDASQFAILLSGPPAEIERQGPPLVRALRHTPHATVISPWDRGTVTALRPGPRNALVIVDYHVPLATAMRDTVPELEAILDQHVHSPLRATQSGFASVSRALQEETIDATERAELLAVPLLLLVLLLVFRSVVAAAIPLAFGALTVFAGRGVLVLLSSVMTVDAISLVVCTMMGLALGVDYSLLIVSRFREELAEGSTPLEAALRSRATAGRTTVFAGSTLLAALALSAFVQPGSLLLSLAATVGVATVLSVLVAVAGLPGLLALLGERVNAGRIGPPQPPPVGLPCRRDRRPRPAPPRPRRDPDRDPAGAARRARRSGSAPPPRGSTSCPAPTAPARAPKRSPTPSAPAGKRRSSSSPRPATGRSPPRERLALLGRWQRRIAAQPGIRAVIGPAAVAKGTKPLRELGETFTSTGKNGPASLAKLGPGLHHASDAVSELRSGLAQAAEGSGLLGEGAEHAQQGADLLAGGLDSAAAAGAEAGNALNRLAAGTKRLSNGQRKTAAASLNLALEMRSLLPAVRGGAPGPRPPAGRGPGSRSEGKPGARKARDRSPRPGPRALLDPQRSAPPAQPRQHRQRRAQHPGRRRPRTRRRDPDARRSGRRAERRADRGSATAPDSWRPGSANSRAAPSSCRATSPAATRNRSRSKPACGAPACGSRRRPARWPPAPATCSAARPTSSTPATSCSPLLKAPRPGAGLSPARRSASTAAARRRACWSSRPTASTAPSRGRSATG